MHDANGVGRTSARGGFSPLVLRVLVPWSVAGRSTAWSFATIVPASTRSPSASAAGHRRVRRPGHEDVEWGNIASDRLAAQLDAYNKQYPALPTGGPQAAQGRPGRAGPPGRLQRLGQGRRGRQDRPRGRDDLRHDERHHPRRGRTPRCVSTSFSRSTKEVQLDQAVRDGRGELHHRRRGDAARRWRRCRSCGSTTARRTSPAARGAALVAKLVGMGGGNLPAGGPDSQRPDRRVRAGVRGQDQPAPGGREREARQGQERAVKTGNKLAVAGDYAEALEAYQAAVEANARRPRGGVQLRRDVRGPGQARPRRSSTTIEAFKIKPQEQYVLARKRVRMEGDTRDLGSIP